MRFMALLLTLVLAGPVAAQYAPAPEAGGLNTTMPPIPPLTMYEEILAFRAQVDARVAAVLPRAGQADLVVSLVDETVADWDTYGDFMDREHGDFPNMSRGRPYWFITTDDAADTLTDRIARVIEAYTIANPDEKLGAVRAEWEKASSTLGVPRSRVYGFQVVELARRGSVVRKDLEAKYPAEIPTLRDAYIRFLWDLVQFYRQLHSTWFDRHTMRVSQEDWIIHRLKGRCENPEWRLMLSFTAIGVDTTNMDPLNDKFMHRIVVTDPACPETVDFVVPLPHYRRMEKELQERTAEERQELLRRYQEDAAKRGGAPGGSR
jgi:hypothetical protein